MGCGPLGDSAWRLFGAGCRKALVSIGWAISLLSCTNRCKMTDFILPNDSTYCNSTMAVHVRVLFMTNGECAHLGEPVCVCVYVYVYVCVRACVRVCVCVYNI